MFHLLDISVKFRDDSFIGCQDICENALHWLICWRCSPKSGFWGINGWWLTLETNDTLGIYLPPKHVLWCIERQATFYGLLCRLDKETKKRIKEAREVATSPPTSTLYPLRGVSQFWHVGSCAGHAKF